MNVSPQRDPSKTAHLQNSVKVHPTAVVSPGAELGEGVEIGPYTIIGQDVRIGRGTTIGSHCVIDGWTVIGENCRISHSVIIGLEPQDLKYKGEKTLVRIGNSNIIREFATIHRATGEGCETVVGDGNFIMAYVHIAHNCRIGNNTIIANAVNLAGHITIEDYATVGGLTPIHQFVRVGEYSFIGGGSRIPKDIVPYVKVAGNPARACGLNTIGLIRHGFTSETRQALKRAYRLIFRSEHNVSEAVEIIKRHLPPLPQILHLVEFIEKSERGITL